MTTAIDELRDKITILQEAIRQRDKQIKILQIAKKRI